MHQSGDRVNTLVELPNLLEIPASEKRAA